MRHRQPLLPSRKFSDRRKKKLTPVQIQEKLKLEEQRRLEKLERQAPKSTDPHYKGLMMAALLVGTDHELVGLVAGLAEIDLEDPQKTEIDKSKEN